jgi:hypothetical protein
MNSLRSPISNVTRIAVWCLLDESYSRMAELSLHGLRGKCYLLAKRAVTGLLHTKNLEDVSICIYLLVRKEVLHIGIYEEVRPNARTEIHTAASSPLASPDIPFQRNAFFPWTHAIIDVRE